MKTLRNKVYLPDIVGSGYGTFWRFKGRYRVVKGSRRSKKSKTMALWVVYNMMKYQEANTLVVRKVFRTIADSCYTELRWAAKRLMVDHLWDFRSSPLEATYRPTGQKIYFRGLDDPLKITSIACSTGVLCWVWVEEAYEITREDDFDTLVESILGDCPPGLFKQTTLTFNPWNERHWIKRRFFDAEDTDTLAMTTNYKCNEWLSDEDRLEFDKMAAKNPKRYKVAGLGDWGVVEGVIYENWKEEDFDLDEIRKRYDLETVCGLDFGYTNDPTAFVMAFFAKRERKLFIWDEMYEPGLSNRQIAERIINRGYGKERIIADSAEPKSIAELRRLGLRAQAAVKGRDSVSHGIQYIQDLEITVMKRCTNTITELENYTWAVNRQGVTLNEPIDGFNHAMDALRYALEGHIHTARYYRLEGGGL